MNPEGVPDAAAARRRIAGAAAAIASLGAAGAPPRGRQSFGGIEVGDLGVDTPYAVRAALPAGPVAGEDLSAALAWCASRPGGRGYRVDAAEPDLEVLHAAGLRRVGEMPVFAMPAAGAAALPHGSDVTIGPPVDRDEIVAGYGGWMGDLDLARGLILPADLLQPERRFLVARLHGDPVGCALIWYAAGTAYLSGIGVEDSHRGRGYGLALTAAAGRLGAQLPGVDLLWMFASDEGSALYAGMGFTRLAPFELFGPAI